MLPFLRKNVKTFIWVIVLSFAIWGVGSIAISRDKTASYAGSVFGKNISHKDFLSIYRLYDLLIQSQRRAAQFRQTEKDKPNPEATPESNPSPEASKEAPDIPPPSQDEIRGLTWQTIILNQEAKREHIKVSDEEVAEEVQSFFGGAGFNPIMYKSWVETQFRARPRDFEEAVRQHLTAQKMRTQVLKDTPDADKQKKWMEWLSALMLRAHLEDYTQTKESEAPPV